jgi:preprotein translocase subunit SecE
VARDRQRAKQRKARRAGRNPGPAPSEPHRSNVPGELEHASGEVDEFDAALVSGAGGHPADADAEAGPDADRDLSGDAAGEREGADPGAEHELGEEDLRAGEDDVSYEVRYDDEAELRAEDDFGGADPGAEDHLGEEDADEDFEDDDEDLAPAGGAVPSRRRRSGAEPASATAPGAPAHGGPGRFLAFLRASWAELQRVQWPDRRQVAQATAVVLGFVVVAGLYLGVADRVAQEVVDFII